MVTTDSGKVQPCLSFPSHRLQIIIKKISFYSDPDPPDFRPPDKGVGGGGTGLY